MMMHRRGTRPELGTRPLPVEVKPVVAVPLGEVTVLLFIDAHFLVMACCVPTNGGDDRVGPRFGLEFVLHVLAVSPEAELELLVEAGEVIVSRTGGEGGLLAASISQLGPGVVGTLVS